MVAGCLFVLNFLLNKSSGMKPQSALTKQNNLGQSRPISFALVRIAILMLLGDGKSRECPRSKRYWCVASIAKTRISLTFVLLVAPSHFFIIENFGAAAARTFSAGAFPFLPIWPVSRIETYGLGRSNGGERRNAHATPEI
jgi:hypothetical protein